MVLVTIILDFVIISATKHPLLNTDLRQVSQTDRSFAIGIHRDPRPLTRSSLHLRHIAWAILYNNSRHKNFSKTDCNNHCRQNSTKKYKAHDEKAGILHKTR